MSYNGVEEVGALLGETQRFECQVIGFPTPTISWYKDEINITNNLRYFIDSNKEQGTITLILRNVTLADEGLYQCRAENTEGYATTTAYLVVKIDPNSGSSKDYSSMTIEKLSEEEHSQVEVFKDGRQTIIEEIITRVEESEREIIEEKAVAPKITYDNVLKQGLSLKAGQTIYIEVNVSGYPRPAVHWFHEDHKLEVDSRSVVEVSDGWSFIKINGVTDGDAGSYKVTAENAIGFDSATFTAHVKGPPSVPLNLRIIEVSRDFVVIGWDRPKSDGGEKIIGYEIEKVIKDAGFVNAGYMDEGGSQAHLQFKVSRLREGSECAFRVIAENRIGMSPAATTDTVIVKLPFDPPGPPRDLKVKDYSKDFVTLTWDKPEMDGGSAIAQYIIEKSDVTRGSGNWIVSGTISASEHTYKVTKLIQGNSYVFRVSAENGVGVGPPTELKDKIIARLPYDKPEPPRNLHVLETDVSHIRIGWEVPESDGGSPITGYTVEKKDLKRNEFVFIAQVDATTLNYDATRLFEGNEYTFRVSAENLVGPSLPTELDKPVRAKLPFDEPEAPRNLLVKDYWTDNITIVWDAPNNDGGTPLTGYLVEKRDIARPMWIKAGTVEPDVRTFQVTGLYEGSDYIFRVYAANKIGQSKEAAESDRPCRAKMPFDPPFAPLNLKVASYNVDHVVLTWEPPSHDGGSLITGYVVEKRDAFLNLWTQAGTTVQKEDGKLNLKVTGLFEGQNYLFRVAAENQCGRGAYAETVKPVTAKSPFDIPSAPRNLRLTDVWKDYAGLMWEEPETDGGSPLTNYAVYMRDVSDLDYKFVVNVNANTTAHQVTNLKENHEYNVRVYSENAAGLSEQPAELKPAFKAQLPYGIPLEPTNLHVTSTDAGAISVAWNAPKTDGGSPITGYVVEYCRSGSTNWVKSGATEAFAFELTDVKEGELYFVRVFSENIAGRSKKAAEISEPVRAKKALGFPETPANLRVTDVTTNSLRLVWDAPTAGSPDVSQYLIDMREETESEYFPVGRVDGKVNTFTVEFLRKGKLYRFRVRAKNDAGFSVPPAELETPVQVKIPLAVPSQIENFRLASVTSDSVTVVWDVSNGEVPISRYNLEASVGNPDAFTLAAALDASATSATLSDLKTNTRHYIRISAENEAGLSNYEEVSVKLKKEKKDASQESAVVQAKTEVCEEQKSEAIVEKKIESKIEAKEEVKQEPKQESVQVKAEIKQEATTAVASVAAAAAEKAEPGTPSNFHVSGSTFDSISLAWDAPKSDGGAPIKHYIIVIKEVTKKKKVPTATLR